MKPNRLFSLMLIFGGCSSVNQPEQFQEVVTPKEHAIVVVIDTLRADVVARVDTPTFDRLANEGSAAERAWSAGTWTVPSVFSLLTGMSVREHGWDLPAARIGKYPKLPPAQMLASVLQRAGFETTGLYSNPYLAEALGFDRGFDTWLRSHDKSVVKNLRREIASRDKSKRQFYYIHILGPHSPLKPNEATRARHGLEAEWFEENRGLGIGVAKRNKKPGARLAYMKSYAGVVEETDQLLADILAEFEPLGDSVALVVTSDHGELIGEHDIAGHGSWVYEQLTSVPMVAVGTAKLPKVLNNSVTAALITDAVGVDAQWPSDLADPLPLVAMREGVVAMSFDGVKKAIWDKQEQMFDLDRDPNEEEPTPLRTEIMMQRLKWEATHPNLLTPSQIVDPQPEAMEQLKELGYVEEGEHEF